MTHSTPTDRKHRGAAIARFASKKTLVVVAVTALFLGIAGGAYAYWTNQGTGAGTGTTGTNQAITINQTAVISDLKPGGAAQSLNFTFTNPNTGPVYVASVTATVGTVTKAGGAATGTCDATDYIIANSPMTIGVQVAAGTSTPTGTFPTVAFNNKPAVNQDACKGATVAFTYTSN